MNNAAAALFLCILAVLCSAAGTKVKGYIVTFHLEGDAEEGVGKFVTPVKLGSEHRQYYFRKMPAFSDDDIAWFHPFHSQDGGSYGVAFRLKEHKIPELTAITVSNQGRLFGSRVADAPLRAVIIDRPINDGILVVWDGLTQNHVKLLSQKIPHVDQVQGNMDLPSFDLSQGRNSRSKPGDAAAGAEKKPRRFFGNALRKKDAEPVNPYANPPAN